SHQKYWQMLPVNPTGKGQGYSPYSAFSSTAGNTILISPELLEKESLLSASDLQKFKLPLTGKVDFNSAEQIRNELFEIAWHRYKSGDFFELKTAFDEFKLKEFDWLKDFAFYTVLKEMHAGKPWYDWPEEHKLYNAASLSALSGEIEDKLEKVKWLQCIFNMQLLELKNYCHSLNIELIGDIPFYVSYDSADVWANRKFFALDVDGKMVAVAGVPPDFFSEDGQLWGMPVFNWKALKEDNFSWWMKRLKRNKDLFDLLRLDHFRAFSSYWEVPSEAKTAKSGKWEKGPGDAFFHAAKETLNSLPFIAEDLGDIDKAVYDLRDHFNLAGMKVLQFAFGSEMPHSPHIPHNFTRNFFVYTGTHDNNTVKGWYRSETEKVKKEIDMYLNTAQSEETIAESMSRLAYSSVANTIILPLQDLLNLDEESRMNTPSSIENNWTWQLQQNELKGYEKLREWVSIYNRE
ncbi:MAG TPA: 4-alpha-glucanotransferase, partial [Flavisolibacter sp.]|nr:4-alpha-glucanotransferase [Flavisolibacter sp.]